MLDKATAMNLACQYAQVVKKAVNPDSIVFFGSFINGTPHENSDIDIAVIKNNFYGEYFEVSQLLHKLRRDISADISPILLDLNHDPSGFAAEVMRTGLIIG